MLIFPAIDLFKGKAVRLLKGNYNEMTVYSSNPAEVAQGFKEQGATHLHLVDLEGARDANTSNLPTVEKILSKASLFTEIGGGIRDIKTAEKYFSVGVNRVILGTAAVENESFLKDALYKFGEKIAVGVDIKDGKVAIRGWLEKSELDAMEFISHLEDLGVATIICTDISRDGAMRGANHELYKEISQKHNIKLVASGGVSSIEDVKKLREAELYAAIVGKAYYTGAINLKEAIEVAK